MPRPGQGRQGPRDRVSRARKEEDGGRAQQDVLETLKTDVRNWESEVDRFSAEAVSEGRRLNLPKLKNYVRSVLPDMRRMCKLCPVHHLVILTPLPGSGRD
ncbi:MAG: hypothetical protein LBT40_15220 [Deltaproteobacteria bacterium]|jgi:hypothetical protein|nr:hypothetical protein [Deltaproteobacteria bacterium]